LVLLSRKQESKKTRKQDLFSCLGPKGRMFSCFLELGPIVSGEAGQVMVTR
jgi:hypothetical protein